jgi:1,4-alpha-glucan branching enzyme/maltooligosyltrehalose trehalohydrolase
VPVERAVIYELHVGTFTPDGTFAGVAERLPYLAELGVTAIELDAYRRLSRLAQLGI